MIQRLKNQQDIQEIFMQALENNEDKVIFTALSGRPIVYELGEDFAEKYMNMRKEKGIFLKSLRFSSDTVDTPKHTNYSSYNKEARIAPEEISLADSMLIWDDTVAVIDTKDFTGIVIQDEKHAKIVKQWLEYIWNNSISS